jgi:hypothetical protein
MRPTRRPPPPLPHTRTTNQVQVILDKPGRPFRCLDAQYRRELVRVYLTNVESICRRFCDDKRARLAWLKAEVGPFREWWEGLSTERQRRLTAERGEVVLKGVVKQFFNEKEVTSTLVMDALFAGCRQLEEASRAWAAVSGGGLGVGPGTRCSCTRWHTALAPPYAPRLVRPHGPSLALLRAAPS